MAVTARPSNLTAALGAPAASFALAGPSSIGATVCRKQCRGEIRARLHSGKRVASKALIEVQVKRLPAAERQSLSLRDDCTLAGSHENMQGNRIRLQRF